MSFAASVAGAVANVVLAVAIPFVAALPDASMHRVGGIEILMAVTMFVVVAVLGVAGAFLWALVLAPAMSGVDSLWSAFKRAMSVVSGVSSVHPVASLAIVLLAANGEGVNQWLRRTVGMKWDEPVMVLLFMLPVLWAFAWLLLALFLDGRGGGREDRSRGECRCERCGYDLKVIPDEQVCPECGHPVALSFDPGCREQVPAERRGGLAPARFVETWWGALWMPRRFWGRHQVRRDSRRGRNLFLGMMLLAGILSWALFVACMMAVPEMTDDGEAYGQILVTGLGLLVAMCGAALMGNQLILLVAQAVSRSRGNTMRSDELARIGYYALGLPTAVQIVSAHLAIVFLVLAVRLMVSRMFASGSGSGHETVMAVLYGAALVFALAIVAAALWSLVSVVRGQEACRYANY